MGKPKENPLNTLSIDEISKVFLTTASKTLEKSTGQEVTYSNTIQRIPKVSMKPDLTCFVQFDGDYIGLVILNFTAEAAYETYKKYMLHMGMPKEELASSISSPKWPIPSGRSPTRSWARSSKISRKSSTSTPSLGSPRP
jgi:hypothetical protein